MIARNHDPVRGLATDEAASRWLFKRLDGPLSASEQAEFEAWRSQSESNAAAFEKAEAAWNVFADADGDPHLEALRESALEVGPEPRRGWWLGAGAGIAASLLALVAFNLDLNPAVDRQPVRVASAPSPATADTGRPDHGEFVTAKGERRTIDLADGSAVTLNTDSAVRVAYAPGRRLVRLLRGQALFEVAKDHRRPFVVQAADRQVTALGTVFEVQLDSDRMKVTLVEGKVLVDTIVDRPAKGGAEIVPTVLIPGQEFVAAIGTPPLVAKVDVDQELRWRQGFVEFDDEPLQKAIDEMNRYSTQQIVLRDPSMGELRVSGVFRTGNPERFAAILGELLPVRSRVRSDERIELSAAGDERR